MVYLLITCVMFAVAIAINSASVYAQKSHKFYDRYNNGWLWHRLIILPSWIAFVVLAATLHSHYSLDFHAVPLVGYALIAIGLLIFGLAVHEIGTPALTNGNFFGKGETSHAGIFHYLKNPMYGCYVLLFLGIGFVLGNAAYFILAAESFIGLNIIESRVERIKERGSK